MASMNVFAPADRRGLADVSGSGSDGQAAASAARAAPGRLDAYPRVAMRILWHSKIAVTMEIYTEAPSEATRDALRKLGELFG